MRNDLNYIYKFIMDIEYVEQFCNKSNKRPTLLQIFFAPVYTYVYNYLPLWCACAIGT